MNDKTRGYIPVWALAACGLGFIVLAGCGGGTTTGADGGLKANSVPTPTPVATPTPNPGDFGPPAPPF